MYRRILLASDGARESLVALREGALIARALGAEVFLLIIEADNAGLQLGGSVIPITRDAAPLRDLLARGLARLHRLGVKAAGDVRQGDPALMIANAARAFDADLVVVGHRRTTLLERWWSGPTGAYLVDSVRCSVLVARDVISDAEFEAQLAAEQAEEQG